MGSCFSSYSRSTSDEHYELVCYFLLTTLAEPGLNKSCETFGSCEIDSDDYYVGFISYSMHQEFSISSMTMLKLLQCTVTPEVDVNFGQVLLLWKWVRKSALRQDPSLANG